MVSKKSKEAKELFLSEMDKGYATEMNKNDMLALEYEAEYAEENGYKRLSKEEAAERVRLFLDNTKKHRRKG